LFKRGIDWNILSFRIQRFYSGLDSFVEFLESTSSRWVDTGGEGYQNPVEMFAMYKKSLVLPNSFKNEEMFAIVHVRDRQTAPPAKLLAGALQ
jgi:hypothetical protein